MTQANVILLSKPVQDTTRNEESDVRILCNCVYVQCRPVPVGYVVKEARDAVYDALIMNDITVVKFKSVTGTVWAQGFLPQLITTKGVYTATEC